MRKKLEPPHQRLRRGPGRRYECGNHRDATPIAVSAGPVRRRGVVLLVAVVCVAVSSLIFLSVLRLSVAQRQGVEAEGWQIQAGWLAESALERAAARLAADPNYQGETWNLPAGQLGTRHAAVVRIHVEALPEQKQRRVIRAQADYPEHPQHRARHTKQITIDLKPTS